VGNILLQDDIYKLFFEQKTEDIANSSQKIERKLTNLLAIRSNAIELNKQIKETGASKTITEAIKKLKKQISDGQKLSNLSSEEVKKYSNLVFDTK
jgi:negative regulator of replication initiation